MQKQEWMNGKNLASWAGLSLLFVVTRGLLALPWMLIAIPRNNDLTTVLRCAATLVIWALIVLPEHRFHCWAIMRMNGDESGRYGYWQAIMLGLDRTLYIIWAVVPAIALALLLYYTMTSNIGSLKILKSIGSIGNVFTGQTRPNYDLGLAIIIAGLLVYLVLVLVYWYRHTPCDYLGRLKSMYTAPYDGLALRNFLLAAAAYVLWALILLLFLRAKVSGAKGLMQKASKAVSALQEMATHREFRLEMGLVLLLVYCPLWCVRKQGAAKAAANLRDAS